MIWSLNEGQNPASKPTTARWRQGNGFRFRYRTNGVSSRADVESCLYSCFTSVLSQRSHTDLGPPWLPTLLLPRGLRFAPNFCLLFVKLWHRLLYDLTLHILLHHRSGAEVSWLALCQVIVYVTFEHLLSNHYLSRLACWAGLGFVKGTFVLPAILPLSSEGLFAGTLPRFCVGHLCSFHSPALF